MDIADRLNEEFRRQNFPDPRSDDDALGRGRRLAEGYADMERAVAVLSDMLSDTSYIYYGRYARTLGLGADADTAPEGGQYICSIWEREIFSRNTPTTCSASTFRSCASSTSSSGSTEAAAATSTWRDGCACATPTETM